MVSQPVGSIPILLVVDDDDVGRRATVKALASRAIQCVEAASIDSAASALGNLSPTVVILDLMFGGARTRTGAVAAVLSGEFG